MAVPVGKSVKVEERVHRDFVSGVESGVNGTPTLFINGNRYDDSYEFDQLTSAIEWSTIEKTGRMLFI